MAEDKTQKQSVENEGKFPYQQWHYHKSPLVQILLNNKEQKENVIQQN